MAAQSRGTSLAVSRQLADEPYRFAFFQAVRVLERLAAERAGDGLGPAHLPVGADNPPRRETARFRALPALTFPPAEVVSLTVAAPTPPTDTAAPLAGWQVIAFGIRPPWEEVTARMKCVVWSTAVIGR